LYRQWFVAVGDIYCRVSHNSISRPVGGRYHCLRTFASVVFGALPLLTANNARADLITFTATFSDGPSAGVQNSLSKRQCDRNAMNDDAEVGYFAVRAALAKALPNLADRALPPAMARFVAVITERFGIVVSEGHR